MADFEGRPQEEELMRRIADSYFNAPSSEDEYFDTHTAAKIIIDFWQLELIRRSEVAYLYHRDDESRRIANPLNSDVLDENHS